MADMRSNRWKHKLLIVLPPLCLLALFLNKPFHIDDTLFLTMSDLMPWTFFGDAGGEAHFLGVHYEHLNPYESTHPLFISWFLKGLDALEGSGAPRFWVFHLGFLIFPAMLLFFMSQWLQIFSKDPKWLWLLAASPVFFVNSTNLMADLAMTAFWCGTIAGVLGFIHRGRPHCSIQAVLCFLGALLTSYQSVALFPLVALIIITRRAQSFKASLLILIPLLGLLAYLWLGYVVSGFFPFLASNIDINIASEVQSGFNWALIGHKLLATFDFLGLGLLGVTPLLLWHQPQNGKHRLALMFGAWLFMLVLLFLSTNLLGDGYQMSGKLVISGLVAIGSFWTIWAVFQAWRGLSQVFSNERQATFLLLGSCLFLGVTFYNIVLLPYGTARYVLPALPGAWLLVAFQREEPLNSRLIWPVLLLSVGLSLFMTRVDMQQARADWQLYQQVTQKAAPDQIIRFSDDAGLVRYFKAGTGAYLPKDATQIDPDQLLLVTRGLIHPDVLKSIRLVEEINISSFWGWTLFDTQAKAGFYRSLDGLLPMSRSDHVRRGFLYKVTWFEQMIDQVEPIQLGNANYFRRAAAEFPNRGTKHGLFMHPDVTIAYPWQQEKPLQIVGTACPLPPAWDKEGDGVTCTIGIRQDGEMKPLWSATIDAKNRPEDREGASFKVIVPPEADAVWFQVGPGPLGDYRHDSMLWYDLAILPIAAD